MVPGAHGDAEAVEQCAHVEVVDVAHEEAHHGVFVGSLADESHAGDAGQLLHAVACEVVLMGGDAVDTDALDIVDGHSQSAGGDIVGCAGLELQRRALEGGVRETHRVDHLAAALIGWHLVEPPLLAVEDADARGAVHLVAAEGEEVAVEGLHVDAHVRGALGAVDEHGHLMVVGDADEPADGVDGA